MESCCAVEKEVDKVLSRFRKAQNQTLDYTQEIIDQLATIQKELQECNDIFLRVDVGSFLSCRS